MALFKVSLLDTQVHHIRCFVEAADPAEAERKAVAGECIATEAWDVPDRTGRELDCRFVPKLITLAPDKPADPNERTYPVPAAWKEASRRLEDATKAALEEMAKAAANYAVPNPLEPDEWKRSYDRWLKLLTNLRRINPENWERSCRDQWLTILEELTKAPADAAAAAAAAYPGGMAHFDDPRWLASARSVLGDAAAPKPAAYLNPLYLNDCDNRYYIAEGKPVGDIYRVAPDGTVTALVGRPPLKPGMWRMTVEELYDHLKGQPDPEKPPRVIPAAVVPACAAEVKLPFMRAYCLALFRLFEKPAPNPKEV